MCARALAGRIDLRVFASFYFFAQYLRRSLTIELSLDADYPQAVQGHGLISPTQAASRLSRAFSEPTRKRMAFAQTRVRVCDFVQGR